MKSPASGVVFALGIFIFVCQISAIAVPREHAGRFAGLWLIDQPFHALYEATLYRFNSDGSIEVPAQAPVHFQTGSICSKSTADTCVFGGEWYSKGPDTLLITLQCGALGQRIGTFVFPDSSRSNCSNPDIWCGNTVAIAVQQDTTWRHCDFEWRWTKCIRGDFLCFRPFGTRVSAKGLDNQNRIGSKRAERIEFADLNGRIIAASQAVRGNHIVIQKTAYVGGGQTARVVYFFAPAARSNCH